MGGVAGTCPSQIGPQGWRHPLCPVGPDGRGLGQNSARSTRTFEQPSNCANHVKYVLRTDFAATTDSLGDSGGEEDHASLDGNILEKGLREFRQRAHWSQTPLPPAHGQ